MRIPAGPLGWGVVLVLALAATRPTFAHNGAHPSVHDTVAGVIERLKQSLNGRQIRGLTATRAGQWLTAEEREVLATGHLRFQVNQPVQVTVFHDRALGADPYWLAEPEWRRVDGSLKVGSVEFELWQRDFPAGDVGLGVNSLGGGGRHYLVGLRNLGTGDLAVTDLYPGNLRTAVWAPGVQPWADRTDTVASVPAGFEGQMLVQTLHARRDDGRLTGRLRWTSHPSSRRPDQVVLTWAGDPRTSQAIQWRTARSVNRGAALVIESGRDHRPLAEWRRIEAETTTLTSISTANDPVVHRHTAVVDGLQAATTYTYRVGDGRSRHWGPPVRFTTAPEGPADFGFVYMGDAQNGLDTWGRLVRGAFRSRPDVAFYLMAGDLVDRGNERDDWDDFFHNARGVFDRRTLVPVIGNHECQGGQPTLYLGQFALPRNGPPDLPAERVYAFEYGNALFVVLDSNLPPEKQTDWLEDRLRTSDARWKIVSYHHPAYSSAPNRDNVRLRELWTPVFDRHGVDLALQGHDHAYLRTHPIRGGQRVENPAAGTTYIVSVSGTKLYPQADRPETVVGFTNVATWQVLDLRIAGDRLTYRSYDRRGTLRDDFVIDKGSGSAR